MTIHARRSLVASALALASLAAPAAAQWTQWGGPDRDFRSPATGLADAWPEGGPRTVWERALGAGYSAIVADGGRLFTLYRGGDEEVIVALDAETGTTLWEHRYRTSREGPPNSTPALAGGRLFALGSSGVLSALDAESGELAWSHDLVAEYGAQPPSFGFAASPLVHGDALVLPVGGKGFGVAAFALADGKLLWHRHDFEEAYASPVLIDVEGEAQVAVLVAHQLVGLSPATGELLWREPIEGDQHIPTPVWSADDLLFVPVGGGRALRFSKVDGETRVETAWKSAEHFHMTTVVRVGDHLFGTTGGEPATLTAIRAATGEVAWREPGLIEANVVAADGKLVLLDYDGVLALATAGPTASKPRSKVSMLEHQAYTVPTLVGERLYLRDLKTIKAVDLGKPD